MLLQDGLAKYGQSLQNLLVLLLTFAFVLTDFSAFDNRTWCAWQHVVHGSLFNSIQVYALLLCDLQIAKSVLCCSPCSAG